MRVYRFAENFLAKHKDIAEFVNAGVLYDFIGKAFQFLSHFIQPPRILNLDGTLNVSPQVSTYEINYTNNDFIISNIQYKPKKINYLYVNNVMAKYVPDFSLARLASFPYYIYSYNFSYENYYPVVISGLRFNNPTTVSIKISFALDLSIYNFRNPEFEIPISEKYLSLLEDIVLYDILLAYRKQDANIINQLRVEILNNLSTLIKGTEYGEEIETRTRK